jgi:hypothetical protein
METTGNRARCTGRNVVRLVGNSTADGPSSHALNLFSSPPVEKSLEQGGRRPAAAIGSTAVVRAGPKSAVMRLNRYAPAPANAPAYASAVLT